MGKIGEYLHRGFALAVLGLVPWLHSQALCDPAAYPQFMGLLLCCLAAFVLLFRFRSGTEVRLSPWPAALLMALALWSLASSTWALNPAEAWWAATRWTIAAALTLLFQWLNATKTDYASTLLKVATASLALLSLLGLLQSVGVDPLALSDKHHNPNATFANKNFYGTAMAAGMVMAGFLAWRLRGLWRWLSLGAAALMLAGIVVAGTRAAIVPLVLGAAIFPPIIIWRQVRGGSRWALLGAWLLLAVAGGWSSLFVLKQKDARIHYALLWEDGKIVTPQSSSLDYRLIGWHHTQQLARERLLTGHGAGNWKLHIQRIGLQSFDDAGNFGMVVPLHPHNEFLLVAADLGLPGLLLLLAVWGVGIWGAARLCRRQDASGPLGWLLLWLWLCMTVDASFSFPLERPWHLCLLALVLALSAGGLRTWVLPARWRAGLLAGGAALLVPAAVLMGARMQADAAVRKVRTAKDAQQPAKVLQHRPQSTNWASQLDPVAALSMDWYAAMAHAQLQQLPEALARMELAAKVSPNHLAVRSGRASLLDMNGQYLPAIAEMRDLLVLYPNDAEGWLNLSVMHVHAGQLSEARAALARVPAGAFPERCAQVDAVLKASGR